MAVRISRIKIHRAGPLTEDFDIVPGDLNRIFGHNESGKSFVVEALIQLLFRVGKQSTVDWQLRAGWQMDGYVQVTGLGEEPATFEPRSQRKLEDLWDDAAGIPQDLSRLLVVSAGDTRLSRDSADHVGRKLLRDYLSGEALLDEIQGKISNTINSTEVTPGKLSGDRRGPVRDWENSKGKLKKLEKLLENVRTGVDLAQLERLEKKKEQIEGDIKTLERARRYKAFTLQASIDGLQGQLDALPDEQELADIERDIRQFNEDQERINEDEQRLVELSERRKLRDRVTAIRGQYNEIRDKTSLQVRYHFGIVALISLLVSVVLGFAGQASAAAVSALLTAVLLLFQGRDLWIAMRNVGEREEFRRLQEEFKTATGQELMSSASIENILEELRPDSEEADRLERNLRTDRENLRSLGREITRSLVEWTEETPNETNWSELVESLRSERKGVSEKIRKIEKLLRQLGIPEEQYLYEDPGIEWDPQRYQVLNTDLESCNDTLSEIHESEKELKARVKEETDLQTESWAELIEALTESYRDAKSEYVDQTSNVLAQKATYTVCKEYRERENERIVEGLTREEVTQPLRAMTGRYERISYDPEDGINVGSNEGRTFPLQDLSTGAKEQVYLALRIGFASIAMESQTGFLILDDAFQHSDWRRREFLVKHATELVNQGWQVFYFTMDNHIRDLIDDAGSDVKSFKTFDLV